MTQVANRAEFDRVHAMFVAAHQQQQVPCSLLMCDLDRFKLVNDTYGHQAGDDGIKCIASLLKKACRPGDLVARYGGEEFVLLYANCDNASATRRAEHIRAALSKVPHSRMGGRSITASFGVTEIQPGDTPETMLRRADRALLMAKNNGRNNVVQLGAGAEETEPANPAAGLAASAKPKEILKQNLVTAVPIKMAVEKLRGFVADHQAKIVSTEGNHIRLEIFDKPGSRLRRLTDRSASFWLDVVFEEEQLLDNNRSDVATAPLARSVRTKIHVTVAPRRERDRRREEALSRARRLLLSFRAYLMASEEDACPRVGALTRAKKILTPWLPKS
jgi:diguanylate cyclase (GGDEF)-like protein